MKYVIVKESEETEEKYIQLIANPITKKGFHVKEPLYYDGLQIETTNIENAFVFKHQPYAENFCKGLNELNKAKFSVHQLIFTTEPVKSCT